jgi:hypothetical protein
MPSRADSDRTEQLWPQAAAGNEGDHLLFHRFASSSTASRRSGRRFDPHVRPQTFSLRKRRIGKLVFRVVALPHRNAVLLALGIELEACCVATACDAPEPTAAVRPNR